MEKIGSLIGSTRVILKPAHDAHEKALDYQKSGKFEKAEACYVEAIRVVKIAFQINATKPKVSQNLEKVYQDYGQCLQDQGKIVQAKQVLEELAQLRGMSRQGPPQGSPCDRVNNTEFEQHVASLSPCASHFFTQPLQIAPTLARLPCNEAGQIIEAFKQIKTQKLEYIQELVALAAIDHPQQYRDIINALLDGLKPEKNRLLNLHLLRGLSAALLQRTHWTQDDHSVGDCTMVLRALLGWLEKIHVDHNSEQVQTLLHTVSLVLDQMVYLKAKELDRLTIEQPLKRALNRFDDAKKYPECAWPIEYIKQALARLPNNEGFPEALIRRALPALGGLFYLTTFGLKIASAEGFISGFEPDKLWDTYERFKEAFSEIGYLKRAPWYGELCFIDVLIGLGRLDVFSQMLERNSSMRDEMYLRGVCDRLERIVCLQGETEARDSALWLLNGFKAGQIVWARCERIQQYASQSLNRVALMWPTPDILAMEREGYAPAAWHPFWAESTSRPLFTNIQNKAERRANQAVMLSQFPTVISHTEQMQRLLPPVVSLKDLRAALYEHYQHSNLSIQRVSGDKVSLADCYINLAIVESQAQREKDKKELEKQAATFERLPSSERLEATNPNKLVALEKLFEVQKLRDGSEGVPKRILIQGRAGIGKTTLCKKLVYEYHENGLWQDQFESALWIPLRQLKATSSCHLEDLLCRHYFANQVSTKAQALSHLLLEHQSKTLFILDGLDEVTEMFNENHPSNNFLKNLLNQSHILITSRPAGVSASQCNQLDLELETIGFSAQNIKEYIKKFAPEPTQTAIGQFIERTPLIQSLVNIPIQLDALCYSWNKLPQNQAVTMSTLYEAMVDKLWHKDGERLEKEGSKNKPLDISKLRHLPKARIEKVMAAEISYLGYLAFKGLEIGKIEFSPEELDEYQFALEASNRGGLNLPDDFVIDLKKTSYLHTSDGHRPEAERQYHFLHLTFQEFFAAKFLVRHLEKYAETERTFALAKMSSTGLSVMPSQTDVEAFIATHKYNPRYEIVWWMVSGLLNGTSLERFFKLLEKAPRDLIGTRHQQVGAPRIGRTNSTELIFERDFF